jgi:hypothetical protein
MAGAYGQKKAPGVPSGLGAEAPLFWLPYPMTPGGVYGHAGGGISWARTHAPSWTSPMHSLSHSKSEKRKHFFYKKRKKTNK